MKINSETSLYCIFGNPVKHSLSPVIHNSAFRELGINAVYLAFEPETIEEAIRSVRSLNIKGASITIPFKVEVMKYIDHVDPLAGQIGSVNTIHNVSGRLTGYNTDGQGALNSLLKKNIGINNSNILIIGNGGSARAVAFTLLQNKASVFICGRNHERIKALAKDLKVFYDNADNILLDKLDKRFMSKIDILINTTPLGMTPRINSCPIDENLITDRHTVFDIVYSPEKTKLLNIAEKKGCVIIKGIEMLINQGIMQFEIWTNRKAPEEIIYRSIKKILYGENNGN